MTDTNDREKYVSTFRAAPLAFCVGLTLGVAGTYFILDSQYEDRIEAVKEFYQSKTVASSAKTTSTEEHKVKLQKPATDEPAKKMEVTQASVAQTKPAVTEGRHLTETQKSDLAKELENITARASRTTIYAGSAPNQESQAYLAEIIGVLQGSKINIQFDSSTRFASTNPDDNRGLFLGVKNKDNPPEVARNLFVAFRNAGLDISYADLQSPTDDLQVEIIVGYR